MRIFFLACIFSVSYVNLSIACECGLEGSSGRIFKGSQVKANKYPWLAHIRAYPDPNSHLSALCGGTLIDNQHILTAAHCVVNKEKVYPPSQLKIHLGKYDVASMGENLTVTDIWVDPKYRVTNLSHDFAIITLAAPVEFTQSIAPVCLPNAENGLSKLTVAGWGSIGPVGSKKATTLQEVEVDFISRDECIAAKKAYNQQRGKTSSGKIQETHMCAINKQTSGSSCKGDSGGPLMHKGSKGRNYLVGIVSGSWADCGTSDNAAVLYTRVYLYKEKIQQVAPNSCWQDLV